MSLPRETWQIPLLRGIDARGKADLELATTVRRCEARDAVFRNGEVADVLYVVRSGQVVVHDADGREALIQAVSAFGEEALLGPRVRRDGTARARVASDICEIPVHVIERVLVRQGGGEWFEREVRALRRRFVLERIQRSGHRAVGTEVWLDGAVDLARKTGSVVRVPPGARAFVVEGILDAKVSGGGERTGYAAGDYIGAIDASRDFAVAAPVWLVCDAGVSGSPPQETLRPIGGVDLERWTEATSMLLVDRDLCVSCGECEAGCRDAHPDGLARLALVGDTVRATVNGTPSSWLVATSCHHCESPACLVDCPTGAIRRDARGVVRIAADLCTGCGSCERACRWGNIRMESVPTTIGHRVATKCDLCSSREEGRPACVQACPTGALLRVPPKRAVAELGAPGASAREPWRPFAVAWGAAVLVAILPLNRSASGVLAMVANLFLVGYALRRRLRHVRAMPERAGNWLFRAHLLVGTLSLVAALKHGAPSAGVSLPWVLWIAYWLAAMSGMMLVGTYAIRNHASALAHRQETGMADRFRALTGHSNAVKNVYLSMLAPFERSFVRTWHVFVRAHAVRRGLERRVRSLKTLSDSERSALEGIVALALREKEERIHEAVQRLRRALIAAHAVASVVTLLLMIVHGALALMGK